MSAVRPFISVVVPTRDRPAALARCLASLAAQTYPCDRMEVLVVNDGGASVGVETGDLFTGGRRCTIIDVAHAGPAAARNAGVSRAGGEILAFIDDDCFADPAWLEALVARLETTPDAVVGGQVINALPGNRYARASQVLVGFLYRYYHEQGLGRLPFFATDNLAVRSATFARVGAFDESFPFASEDRDWSDRCLLAGLRLLYAPEAIVRHAHPLTLMSFLGQHFRYGAGARRFHQRRARRRGTPIRLEPAGFYRGMLRAPFDGHDPEPWRVALLIATSQVMSALGWATARRSR